MLRSNRLIVLVALLSLAACRRQSARTEKSEVVASPSASTVASTTADDASAPVAPPLGETSWHLAATSKGSLALATLGAQVLVRTKGGPYVAGPDGVLMHSPMQHRLHDSPDTLIVGNGPDDVWAVEQNDPPPSEGTFRSYTIMRWEANNWVFPSHEAEFSDMPGEWYEGFAVLGPGKAVALSHRATEKSLLDVFTTFDARAGKPRDVGKMLGQRVQFVVGTSAGDIYAVSEQAFVHVPPNGEEKAVDLPIRPEAGALTVENITAMSRLGEGVVVSFFGNKNSLLGVFRNHEWNIEKCPFGEMISRIAPTPDGAIWVSTDKSVWRYLQKWESTPFQNALIDAGVHGTRVVDLAATTANDAWISVGDKAGKGPFALLHTKPAASVQRLPLKGPLPDGGRRP